MPAFGLPDKLRDTVTLEEGFQALGRALYSDAWTGNEIAITQVVLPPKEAADLMAEKNQIIALLNKGRFNTVNEGTIRDDTIVLPFRITFFADFVFVPDIAPDGPLYRQKLLRCRDLIAYFDHLPAPDTPEYERAFAEFDRARVTFFALRELLVGANITAFGSNAQGRVVISPSKIGTVNLAFFLSENRIVFPGGDLQFVNVCVVKDEFNAALRAIEGARPTSKRQKVDYQLLEQLKLWMRDAAQFRMTKSEAKQRLEALFTYKISTRVFGNLWREACNATQSGWDKPGRRSTSDSGKKNPAEIETNK